MEYETNSFKVQFYKSSDVPLTFVTSIFEEWLWYYVCVYVCTVCVSYFDRLTFPYHNIHRNEKDILFGALILLQARFCVGFISMYCIRHKKFNISHIILLRMGFYAQLLHTMCSAHITCSANWNILRDKIPITFLCILIFQFWSNLMTFYLFFLLLSRFTLISLKWILLNTHFKMPLR